MQTTEIKDIGRAKLDEVVHQAKRLDKTDQVKLRNELDRLLEQQEDKLSRQKREQQLLRKIKNVIPADVRKKEKRLFVKLQDETISEEEREELSYLLEIMEEKSVEKIYLMAELAKLRGVSVQELVKQPDFRQVHVQA